MPRQTNPELTRVDVQALTPAQKQAWIDAAEADGRSLSSWIKATCDAAAERSRKKRQGPPKK